MSTERFETVVVGAGQAGLATGYHLAARGHRFVILDAAPAVGTSWRRRWDSLRLFTPAHWTHLPGLGFPARRQHLPSKDEMADYLHTYADRFALPVRNGWRVDDLTRDDEGYLLRSGGRWLRADSVVIATGTAMRPRVPAFAAELDASTHAVHAARYRHPRELPEGAVLVVGAGNSGAEIALDLAATRRTLLAGRDTGRIPIALGGAVYRLMNRLLTVDNRLGRRFAAQSAGGGTPLVRVRREDLARAGVELLPPVAGITDGRPHLDDGRVLDIASVIWCTGYVPDYRWIDLPGFPTGAHPAHHRGIVTDQPGLFLVGLPYQSTMASSLVGGVGDDARYVAEHIHRQLAARSLGPG